MDNHVKMKVFQREKGHRAIAVVYVCQNIKDPTVKLQSLAQLVVKITFLVLMEF